MDTVITIILIAIALASGYVVGSFVRRKFFDEDEDR